MRWKATLCCLAVFFLAACHPRLSRQIDFADSKAGSLLRLLNTRNKGLETFKGIGSLRVWNAQGVQTTRIAWLAALDGRMRAVVMGPAGNPLMRFSYDGRSLYFASADREGVRQKGCEDPGLQHILDVPVSIGELIVLLAGRVPVYDYKEAALVRSRSGAGPPKQLVLTNEWSGLREKIRLRPDRQSAASVAIYEGEDLRYQAKLADYRQVNGFSLPGRIVVSGAGAAGFALRAERIWTNVPVEDEQFVISRQ
ncbi:MAG: hypothetical protein R6X08_07060 [Desulfosalsimonadaceae bacterium]